MTFFSVTTGCEIDLKRSCRKKKEKKMISLSLLSSSTGKLNSVDASFLVVTYKDNAIFSLPEKENFFFQQVLDRYFFSLSSLSFRVKRIKKRKKKPLQTIMLKP